MSKISVTTIAGLTSGGDANKVIIESGDTLQVDSNATVGGTLGVTGVSTLSGNATVGGTLGVTGAVTANAGISVDNITIDGTEIDLSSGTLTIDVAGGIILDADGGEVQLHDGGTEFVQFTKNSNDVRMTAGVQDGDIVFRGNDGGSMITALTLDMSDEGAAIFNKNIAIGGQISLSGGTAQSGDFTTGGIHFHDSSTSAGDVMPISFTPSASGNRARAAIGFISQQASGVNGFAGAIGFYTRDAADGTAMGTSDERVRIAQSGYIYVNTGGVEPSASQVGVRITGTQGQSFWNSANSGTGGYNHLNFYNGNGLVGNIYTNGSGVVFNTGSDYRLKENVVTDWDATTRLKQLKPSRFNFKADANTTLDGFLAHEVQSVVPEAISGKKDAMAVETRYTEDDVETQGDNPTKSVGDIKSYSTTEIIPQGIDQSKLVPLLTKALQEAIAKIETLEAKVAVLESA